MQAVVDNLTMTAVEKDCHPFVLNSVVRGHHVYKCIWTPSVGEKLPLVTEVGNLHDKYAVCIKKDGEIVGHVPRGISRTVWYFINHNGIGICEITGKRKHGVGLEVPCTYTFYGKQKLVDKLQDLLTSAY